MSALTRDVLHPVRVKLSPKQVQARRRQAEEILNAKRGQRDTKGATSKRD